MKKRIIKSLIIACILSLLGRVFSGRLYYYFLSSSLIPDSELLLVLMYALFSVLLSIYFTSDSRFKAESPMMKAVIFFWAAILYFIVLWIAFGIFFILLILFGFTYFKKKYSGNMRFAKYLKAVLFTLMPSLSVCFILFFSGILAESLADLIPWGSYRQNADRISLITLVAFYILTILYIIAFIRRKYVSLVILPVSFVVTYALAYIYEYLNPSWFNLGLYLAGVFYTLPFTVISIIAVGIVKIRAIRKQKQ